VVVPSFCSSDFADAVEGVGLEPVEYDVDPGTLALDPGSLREALGEDTLAVVAVNVLGYSSDMAALAATCRAAGVPLLEAIGYAIGATYEGRRLGTFGDCAVLNFQQGKPIPVGGGMVVSHDPGLEFEDAGRPAVGPNVGLLAGYAALGRPRPYYLYRRLAAQLEDAGLAGRATTHPEPKFDVEYAPPFATLSNFQGAVADRLFRRLDDHRRERAATARFYADALADCPGVELVTPVDGLSDVQYVRYPVRIHPESRRDRVQAALDGAGVQATALYDYPPIDADAFPGAARLQRSILTLPTHPYVDDGDRRRIVATVRRVCGADDRVADPDEAPDGDATAASDDATEPPDRSTTSHPGDDSTPAGTE
jgi:perosamine synthetase